MDTLDYVHINGWIAGAINIALLGGAGSRLSVVDREITTLDSQLSNPSVVLASGGRRNGDDILLQPAAHEPRVLG